MKADFRIFLVLLVGMLLMSCQVSPAGIRQTHSTTGVYPAVGPYSQIVQAGNQYFLSGVIPLDASGSNVVGDSIEQQTRQVINYIKAMLRSVDLDLEHVVMSTVYMTDLDEFARMNQVYGEYFVSNAPARATVEVARLPRDVKIEIAVVASAL